MPLNGVICFVNWIFQELLDGSLYQTTLPSMADCSMGENIYELAASRKFLRNEKFYITSLTFPIMVYKKCILRIFGLQNIGRNACQIYLVIDMLTTFSFIAFNPRIKN